MTETETIDMPTTPSGDRLRALIIKIESLNEDKRQISEEIADVFREAKSDGFDVKAMREVLKLRKMKPHDRAELEDLVETYRAAVGLA